MMLITEMLKKELRILRPAALLIVALYALGSIYSLCTEFPDWRSQSSYASQARGMLTIILLFASLIGSNLLVGESEQRTLLFLDALPVSRSRVFYNKLLAGMLVLWLLPVLEFSYEAFWINVIERDSNWSPYPWLARSHWMAGQCLVALYLLAIMSLLSFLRQWFALAVGALVWGYFYLKRENIPWLSLLDPAELIKYPGDSVSRPIPWLHAVSALGMTALCLASAWGAFLLLGDRIRHAADHATRGRMASILRILGMMLVPFVWFMVVYITLQDSPRRASRSGLDSEEDKIFDTQSTEHYDFVFRKHQYVQALRLQARSDNNHDKVCALLGAPPLPGRIVVDLGSPVVQHAAGMTNWTKIRMPLNLGRSEEELHATLAHETAHVYINKLSDGAMVHDFASKRFFHEGLASFVEYEVCPAPGERRQSRRLAAAATAWGAVALQTLMDNDLLSEKRDANLVYPLGEIFCQALVDTHGRAAPGDLLRAMARPDATRGLTGVAFWRDAFQAAGFDFERVAAAHQTLLAKWVEEQKPFIARFPRISARVAVQGDSIVITPVTENHTGKLPGKTCCMLDGAGGIEILRADPDGIFRVARSKYPGTTIRYTPGWSSPALPWPLFEPWREAALP